MNSHHLPPPPLHFTISHVKHTYHAASGEWYLPEGFLNQSFDQDPDTDFTVGGASINQSIQETYRDRLLEELRASAEDTFWSLKEQKGLKQDVLNLLKQKYGFDMDLDEENEEDKQYRDAALSFLKGETVPKSDSNPRKPQQLRQHTLDLSALKNESALHDEGSWESESDTEETNLQKGFQARHNTLNLSEFQEENDLHEENQCSPPGFLEALQEGLRKRKVTWRLSSEEDSSPGNEEHQQSGFIENVQQEPKVGDSPEISDCCGGDGESDGGSCTSHTPPLPTQSSDTEEQSAEQGDSISYAGLASCFVAVFYIPVFSLNRYFLFHRI